MLADMTDNSLPNASDPLPDASTDLGKRVRDRLAKEVVVWLTTVGADGTPQPNPVWFLWEGADSVLVYSVSAAKRIDHVRHRPRVALNFDGNGQGGDIAILTGAAELLEDFPLAHENKPFMEKYGETAARQYSTVENFAHQFPVAIRIRIQRVR
jgi:PPOX class probable F420-dependent enzyme